MKLDVRFQPLDFDIYLSEVIDVPTITSNEYDFSIEHQALKTVDDILHKSTKENAKLYKAALSYANVVCSTATTNPEQSTK